METQGDSLRCAPHCGATEGNKLVWTFVNDWTKWGYDVERREVGEGTDFVTIGHVEEGEDFKLPLTVSDGGKSFWYRFAKKNPSGEALWYSEPVVVSAASSDSYTVTATEYAEHSPAIPSMPFEAVNRYDKSEALLDRALQVIPVGTQTFSRSVQQFPRGISPLYMAGGKGARVWDVDGNEYIDFGAALGPMTLGYGIPEVHNAVKQQMELGEIFGLPTELEVEVSEKLCEMVPCAEMVRFGKNGSDATTGAVRLARAFTGRDHIIQWGYHGWHDWSIGITGRNKGVPQAVRDLTHTFEYNNLASLEAVFKRYPNQIAAVIMEPMNSTWPEPNFLQSVKELAHKNMALFILDETITGFRYANGGASEYFGVVPDLATFGKGIANGYPLSAICGRRDIMRVMEDIHYSYTYASENLSLAAAEATLDFLCEHDVCGHLHTLGAYLGQGVQRAARESGADVRISGHPAWTFLHFANEAQKTLWKQEIFQRGIFSLGQHFISWSHTPDDIHRLLEVYGEVFPILKAAEGKEQEYLRCEVPKPLFKVR